MGGKPAPAVGWALGVERVLELLKEQGTLPDAQGPDVYAIVPDAQSLPVVFQTLQTLRSQGVCVQMHAAQSGADGMGSMKSQFKKADASGARHALVFGEQELQAGQVAIKSLRDGQGEQRLVPISDWPAWSTSLKSV